MPPRYTYWTIIVGGQPTAFRAATQEELLPTLKQLQSKQPDAVMMWFARGKLWPTEEASTFALRQEREGAGRERRGNAWRPGGEHKDPRDKFKVPRDVKRQRFAARARNERIDEERGGADRPKEERPPRSPAAPRSERPTGPREERPSPNRPPRPREDRPGGDRPFRPRQDRPGGDRPFRPREDRPGGDRPFRPRDDRPGGDRPFRPREERGTGGD